ncbi:MAG: GNAT family N-acetyltransferase [Alphaproteobacteria bacterium]|nr:GNAT family N-acetyltransferase [Alphaproteobacteria bacterium]
MKVSWHQKSFEGLSRDNLYEVFRLRQAIFVVEQQCIYPDIDGADPLAHHVLGWVGEGAGHKLVAYARIVPSGGYHNFPDPSIGRVCVDPAMRGRGIARALMLEAMKWLNEIYPGSPIRLQAQQYLESFYQSLGFQTVTPPYDEDGIPHIDMLRPVQKTLDSGI